MRQRSDSGMRFIRQEDVPDKLGISRAKFFEWKKVEGFPKPVPMGRSVVYHELELDLFMLSRRVGGDGLTDINLFRISQFLKEMTTQVELMLVRRNDAIDRRDVIGIP